MTIVDANLLLYAVNADAREHPVALAWLNRLLSGQELVGLPWIVLWGFLRVATNSRIWPNPRTAEQAFAYIREWLALPNVVVPQPGARYAELLEELLTKHRVTGSLVTDATIAALALENGATLASTDRDFALFLELRWINPLAPANR